MTGLFGFVCLQLLLLVLLSNVCLVGTVDYYGMWEHGSVFTWLKFSLLCNWRSWCAASLTVPDIMFRLGLTVLILCGFVNGPTMFGPGESRNQTTCEPLMFLLLSRCSLLLLRFVYCTVPLIVNVPLEWCVPLSGHGNCSAYWLYSSQFSANVPYPCGEILAIFTRDWQQYLLFINKYYN